MECPCVAADDLKQEAVQRIAVALVQRPLMAVAKGSVCYIGPWLTSA